MKTVGCPVLWFNRQTCSWLSSESARDTL